MSNRVITISREFGSGGRTIGRLTAEKLGIPCYDSEIIEKIAEASGLTSEYIADRGEYSPHGNWIANALSSGRSFNGYSVQDYLWSIQKKVILNLAEKESCVIVGRCADYILSDAADCLKVFIHASLEKRAERIVKVYGERNESPQKRLLEKDKRRKSYYRFYTDLEWGIAENYHISLDSGVLGIEKCSDLLTELY